MYVRVYVHTDNREVAKVGSVIPLSFYTFKFTYHAEMRSAALTSVSALKTADPCLWPKPTQVVPCKLHPKGIIP